MPFVDYKPYKPLQPCASPEHNPPNMIVLEPGTYTWKCPACGEVKTFTVPSHFCGNDLPQVPNILNDPRIQGCVDFEDHGTFGPKKT